MESLGRVLIADDEETFLCSTADLVRREGYQCDCAADAFAAADMLHGGDYDLLIADIKMPGNPQLELIGRLNSVAEGVPAILVTAYPSVRSAVHSVQLPVIAYLVKPIDIDELMGKVRLGVQTHRTRKAVGDAQHRLADWRRDLEDVEKALEVKPELATNVPLGTFLSLTLRNIVGCLSDLKHVVEGLSANPTGQNACQLLNCPRPAVLTGALVETIGVLEKTKSAFKSKELGELRKKLEQLVKHTSSPQ